MRKKKFTKKDITVLEEYVSVYFPKLRRAFSDFQPSISNKMNIKEDESNLNNISDTNEKPKKIRNLKEIENYCEHETKFLKGYKAPEIIENKPEVIKIKQRIKMDGV